MFIVSVFMMKYFEIWRPQVMCTLVNFIIMNLLASDNSNHRLSINHTLYMWGIFIVCQSLVGKHKKRSQSSLKPHYKACLGRPGVSSHEAIWCDSAPYGEQLRFSTPIFRSGHVGGVCSRWSVSGAVWHLPAAESETVFHPDTSHIHMCHVCGWKQHRL